MCSWVLSSLYYPASTQSFRPSPTRNLSHNRWFRWPDSVPRPSGLGPPYCVEGLLPPSASNMLQNSTNWHLHRSPSGRRLFPAVTGTFVLHCAEGAPPCRNLTVPVGRVQRLGPPAPVFVVNQGVHARRNRVCSSKILAVFGDSS